MTSCTNLNLNRSLQKKKNTNNAENLKITRTPTCSENKQVYAKSNFFFFAVCTEYIAFQIP